MNKLCILLLIMGSYCVHSKSWNEVFSESNNLQFDQQAPVLINNKIIFKTNTANVPGLFSYDLETNQKSNLIPPDVDYELNDVIQLGDAVYFLIKRFTAQPYFQLWKTDGDLYNTRKVSDLEFRTGNFSPSLVVYGNTLFAQGDNGAILEIQNDQIFSHQVQMYDPYLSHMCVFKEQDFILFDVYNSNKVVRISRGVVTDMTDSFPAGFFLRSAVKINDDCYFNYTVDENRLQSKNILKISEAGQITSFRESNILNKYYSILEHNNKKYAFRDDTVDDASFIVQLAEDDLSELNEFKLTGTSPTNTISTKGLIFLQDYVYQTSRSTQYLLNGQLNLIEKTTVPWETEKPQVQRLMNSDNLVYSFEYSLNKFSLKEISNGDSYSELYSQGFEFINAVSSDTSDQPYFVLKNRETGIKSVFTLDNEPQIGTPLNGIWHDPELINQGLFIKQGIRQNSTSYISITMYTYQNGQPFWLAGNRDFSPGQTSLEIDLFDYRGTEFLELVEEPERNAFGSIEITPLSCDKIHLQLTHEGAVTEFDFSRINNTSYDKYCLETNDQSVTK